MRFNRDGLLEPDGPPEWLARPTARFAATCPFSPAAADEDRIAADLWPDAPRRDAWVGRHRSTWVGHAEAPVRLAGSSGGLATWFAAELLERGLVDGVAHVVPTPAESGRLFAYSLSRSREALRGGARSRYYPIEMAAILREIRATPGRYAVIGVPCFIKAVQLARRAEPVLAERIAFTIGLFCGHMKSARMTDSFAAQAGIDPPRLAAIDYRHKDPAERADRYVAAFTTTDGAQTRRDWWNMAEGDWGAGFFMASACDYCDDVAAECADVSLGDAWQEPWSSDGRGTNVVVVRSEVIEALVADGLAEGRLTLEPVPADLVRESQAGGFRHRREGLAWRLAALQRRWPWQRPPVMPRKRVRAEAGQPLRRRLIYRTRRAISRWSHPLYRRAASLGQTGLYRAWARAALRLYQALAWSSGWLGTLFDRLLPAR